MDLHHTAKNSSSERSTNPPLFFGKDLSFSQAASVIQIFRVIPAIGIVTWSFFGPLYVQNDSEPSDEIFQLSPFVVDVTADDRYRSTKSNRSEFNF
jgi:hypothetical protein